MDPAEALMEDQQISLRTNPRVDMRRPLAGSQIKDTS
jgi:hypothetical protein